MKLFLIAGARPNFMKIAPLIHELRKDDKRAQWRLIHTGQHYDHMMSSAFFEDFDIPEPHYFLNAGSGSHAQQTAKVMLELEKICIKEDPDIVTVVGDVNSTLACSVTAKKLNKKVAHIEAGLRSYDIQMPEEVNRIVTDAISDYLFVTEKSGVQNLRNEGKKEEQIFFVGNIMIDTLFYCLDKLKRTNGFRKNHGPYMVVTLHRPSNVDDKTKLEDILSALVELSKDMPIYFPLHPRTKKCIENFNLNPLLKNTKINLLPPMSYLEFLNLWKNAELVLTDSGGMQEETTALSIPCFTIRENTERPITIEEGTNILVGTTRQKIIKAYDNFKQGIRKRSRTPELWDGKTAQRILERLLQQ